MKRFRGKNINFQSKIEKYSLIAVFCLLFLAIHSKTLSQPDVLKFRNLTVEDGLSQNSVLCIAQDDRGFMWLGTRNGLNRYDGYRFKYFTVNQKTAGAISDNNILSLFKDSKGILWVGTVHGLNKYDPQTETFKAFLPGKQEWSASGKINAITETSGNTLLVGTREGLYLFSPRSGRFVKIVLPGSVTLDKEYSVNDIYREGDGVIWLATSIGAFKLIRSDGHYAVKVVVSSLAANSENVIYNTIAADGKGDLWLGTQGDGIIIVNREGRMLKHLVRGAEDSLSDNHIRKIVTDKSGRIFISTQNGLNVADSPMAKFTVYRHRWADPGSIRRNSLFGLFFDKDSSLWIGSYFGGVNISYNNNEFYSWPGKKFYPKVDDPVVSGIVQDFDGSLWLGTEGNGIIHYSRKEDKPAVFLTKKDGLSSNLIKSLYMDDQGYIWIGTHGGGIGVLSRDRKTFSRYKIFANYFKESSTEIYCFWKTNDGKFLFGSNYGFFSAGIKGGKLDTGSFKLVSNMQTHSIVALENGQFLVGGANGIYLYHSYNNRLSHLKGNLSVNSMFRKDGNNILIGTSRGLYVLDLADNSLKAIFPKSISKNILSILTDRKGGIWLGTDGGLYTVSAHNNIRYYNTNDGIANNQFNFNAAIADSVGDLVFGGYDGITWFNPYHLQVNTQKSNLVFTGFNLLDSTGSDGLAVKKLLQDPDAPKVTVNYRDASFTIEFALLNFINNNKNRYAYYLEGYDKKPVNSTVPAASYINLPPGKYVFHLKGINNDNVASAEKRLAITIPPPFWRTWEAYLFYILAGCGIVFITIRYFFLQEILKKEEVLHQEKLDFFTNVSHEIRTHLTLIAAPVSNLLNKGGNPEEKQVIAQVDINAKRLTSLVNELMDFRKAEKGLLHLNKASNNLHLFLEQIYEAFLPVARMRNIRFSYEPFEDRSVAIYIDKGQMEKVLFNLLSNAFKFTPDGGNIILLAGMEQKFVKVSVADNGKGIDEKYRDKIFDNYFQINEYPVQNTGYGIGLALSKKITALHGGKIYLTKSGFGNYTTCFCVLLKIEDGPHLSDDKVQPDNFLNFDPGEFNPGKTFDEPFSDSWDEGAVDRPTVLVVEDNPEIQKLVVDILAPFYNVSNALNAEAGLLKSRELLPDIIISDVMMPGMNGFEFCKQVKESAITSHIPVIMLTAKTGIDDNITGLDTGADIYMTKPFDSRILLLNIKNALRHLEKVRQYVTSRYLETEVAEPGRVDEDDRTAGKEEKTLTESDRIFMDSLTAFIENNMEYSDLGVQAIAKECAMSAPVLYKKIYALTGLSIHEYIKIRRLQKACSLLREHHCNITEVAYKVGFSDRKYFSKEFKKTVGVNPTEYRKNHMSVNERQINQ